MTMRYHPSFWDPEARLTQLEGFGLSGAVLFPNYGLSWERPLADRLDATLANMRAWNRWAAEVAGVGQGRLYPVAHVTMRDLEWLQEELNALSKGGVRLAMVAPSLVDGMPLSHPDLDRAWSMFVTHGVMPVFHVAAYTPPFDAAWYQRDFDTLTSVMSLVFQWSAPALAIADMAIHGVFARHPDLRLGVVELSSAWVGPFLLKLDSGFDFHARYNGRPLADIGERPSEFVRRQVRVAVSCFEDPLRLMNEVGDNTFMFSSDYPHAEGITQPVTDFERVVGPIEGPRATNSTPGMWRGSLVSA